ncbi:MAG: phenylalanine--tRNA ligase subunit alpha [Nanoarchaeota archaeon]|nr:phenylalanine--tRNA ligase subunit alpha [Nanoarchaeota archaeon]
MDIERIIAKLSPLERRVLPYLTSKSLNEIIEKSGMKDVEVMRALQWLSNKGVVKIIESEKELIVLGNNGVNYKKNGLPEKRFLNALTDKFVVVQNVLKKAGLAKEEMNICVGSLRKKAAIEIKKDNGLLVTINPNGKKLLEKESLEELFLKKQFPINVKNLKPEELFAMKSLLSRKEIIRKDKFKIRNIELTPSGVKLSKIKIKDEDFIDRLTPKMIKSGEWKGKKFREYDVEINVPSIYRGKRHFVNQAIKSAKRIWLDMGFKEMKGNIVQSSFWNFDALFTAQDHPVRDMHDTFFIEDPKNAKLPARELVEQIKNIHENGGNTGSTGWRYKWVEENSRTNVLRTHTTSLSGRMLASLNKEDIPCKYFALGKCFRNETLDWSHLFEFNQTEGIVIDPNANFRHLLGYLKEFFKKMGYEKARFRPAYFPYTELSLEIDVFHPVHKKWVEFGGAGIFRPEVVKPLLGVDVPVLAWGPGFDRIILEFFKINDIRELYKNDLEQLRKIKEWTR